MIWLLIAVHNLAILLELLKLSKGGLTDPVTTQDIKLTHYGIFPITRLLLIIVFYSHNSLWYLYNYTTVTRELWYLYNWTIFYVLFCM